MSKQEIADAEKAYKDVLGFFTREQAAKPLTGAEKELANLRANIKHMIQHYEKVVQDAMESETQTALIAGLKITIKQLKDLL